MKTFFFSPLAVGSVGSTCQKKIVVNVELTSLANDMAKKNCRTHLEIDHLQVKSWANDIIKVLLQNQS